MKSFELIDDIEAPAASVWGLLADLATWSSWNTLIPHAEGRLLPGSQLRLEVRDASGRKRPFRARVVDVHPTRGLVLVASVGAPWLLHMTHVLAVEPTANNGCRLRQTWTVSGLAHTAMWRSLRADMTRFDRIANDLANILA